MDASTWRVVGVVLASVGSTVIGVSCGSSPSDTQGAGGSGGGGGGASNASTTHASTGHGAGPTSSHATGTSSSGHGGHTSSANTATSSSAGGHTTTSATTTTTASAGGGGATSTTTSSASTTTSSTSTSSSSGSGGGGGMPANLFDCAPASPGAVSVKLTQVATGLDHPVDFKPAPGDPTRVFVVEESGKIRLIKNGTLQASPFLDLTTLVDYDHSEQGFLGVAFHPNYQQNGRFFVYYSSVNQGLMTLAEYARSTTDPDHADMSAKQILLTQDTLEENHNGGGMMFSPVDGMLYIGWGDGGGANDQHGTCGNGQNTQMLLGKLLRLDVDHASSGKPYTPAGVVPGALPEIWDFGLRNPWRWSFDACSGDLYIGDVGQNAYEEVDYEPAGQGGKNYGWRCMEGPEATPGVNNTGCPCPTSSFVAPVVPINRSNHGSAAVIGGYLYRGHAIPEARGKYFFGRYDAGATSDLWMVDPAVPDAMNAAQWAFDPTSTPFTTVPSLILTSFGQDLNGEIYLTDYNGNLFRIDPA